jgi:hypothetical protein
MSEPTEMGVAFQRAEREREEHRRQRPVYHCDFYGYPPGANIDDAFVQVYPCCGGPYSERPYGHYANCEGLT